MVDPGRPELARNWFADRYDESARALLRDARAEAERRGDAYVGTEHFLLASVESGTARVRGVLEGVGITLHTLELAQRDATPSSEECERQYPDGFLEFVHDDRLRPLVADLKQSRPLTNEVIAALAETRHTPVVTAGALLASITDRSGNGASALLDAMGADRTSLATALRGVE